MTVIIYMYENSENRIVDVTREEAPQMERIGMVTDALWSDIDNDGKMDLVVVGEWMPLTILRQKTTDEGIILFEEMTSPHLEWTNGWWNSLAAGDFDGDGYMDYVAGNLGLKARWKATKEEPLSVYAKDFDGNGSIDPIMFQYLQGEKFAVPTRAALTGQIPSMKNNFQSYYKYATTTFDEFFSQEQLKAVHVVRSYNFSSALFNNQGDSGFLIRKLPNEAQLAPLFGMLAEDIDQDGHLDLLSIGNFYGNETVTGANDASIGNYLVGRGDGTFQPVSHKRSGWKIDGEARSLVRLRAAGGGYLYLASQYSDSLKVFRQANQEAVPIISLGLSDVRAEITLTDGRQMVKDFYYGDSYLSQSSRSLEWGKNYDSVVLIDYQGNRREINREELE